MSRHPKPKDLKDTLDDLGRVIADAVRLEATPFDQKLDAFKALTTYYGLLLRRRKDAPDDDPDEPTMDNLAATINGAHDGRTRVRGS